MRATGRLACLLAGALALPSAVHAQEARDVVVEFIAGATVYLDAGSDAGIRVGDTLQVYTEAGGAALGSFVVLSGTRTRSVVTFVGAAFAVTRGGTLYVVPQHPVDAPPPDPAVTAAPRARSVRPSAGPQVRGRLSLDVSTLQSSSEVPEFGLEQLDRVFTTPTARLRATVTRLPGDLQLEVNLRGTTRYSSVELDQPSGSFRVYQANLSRTWHGAAVQAGRFNNRYEIYSGYWDGVLLHVGGDGLGIGAMAGFQPQRANEGFSADQPKYTVFVNAAHRGRTLRYATDLSFHEVRAGTNLPSRRFGGWSQRLQMGRFQVSHQVQVDLDPLTRRWMLSQALARSAVPLGPRVTLRGRFVRREAAATTLPGDTLRARRDQGSLGVSVRVAGFTISTDVTANRVTGRPTSRTFSGAFGVPRLPLIGVRLTTGVNYWVLGDTRALYLSGALSHTMGRLNVRASYYRYRSDGPSTSLTHTGELALTFPLTRGLTAAVDGQLQRGANVQSHTVHTGFWVTF